MKFTKPNHWVFDTISQEEYEKAFNIADSRLVYNSLKNDCIFTYSDDSFEDRQLLDKIIELLEISIIELKKHNDDELLKKEFHKVCGDLFLLFRIQPIPDNEIERIKYIYKLITYSYLGEKWESGRRFIIENSSKCKVDIQDENWDILLFKKIYLAFIHLIRKENWNDLHTTSRVISELRNEQKLYEKEYLDSLETASIKGSSYELFGLYHLAKAIDITAEFLINGQPRDIREQIDFHFEKAIESAENSANVEMILIMGMLNSTVKKMVSNSIWMVTQRVNSRVTKFVKNITKSNKPVFELLYPQRHAVLEKGLLDPAHKAVVVDMPTSSGKTLLAEFRILQALNQFSEDNGWVVYVAPTRALVNQVTTRLRRDFQPIDIIVEKMSGALEVDSFEENLLSKQEKKFDVLVTTPEKLNLLIRDNVEEKVDRPLALAVIDEAHNIEDETRGINLEILMANLKNDCKDCNLLLLTPFIPNRDQVAKWLDPDSPNAISLELSWRPNDRVIGAIYPEGRARNWKTYYETILTSKEQIKLKKKIKINESTPIDETRSRLSKTKLAMAVTKQLFNRDGILVICQRPDYCWTLADGLFNELDDYSFCEDEDIKLVKNYVSAELGNNFALKKLLDKRIGVHHSGLPDEVKYLMEWLMEKGKLKVLVATTTIAQGINFPVSTIIMASYAYPRTSHMPVRDFWNLVGRSGRLDQGTLGLVGIVLGNQEPNKQKELLKAKKFIKKSTKELISNLVKMVEESIKYGEEFDLASQFWKPEWSQFLQYITHMFNQCKDIGEFNTKADLFLRRTFGYNLIDNPKKKVLLDAVKRYGKKLNKNRGAAKLSDATGFSMEAINLAINKVGELGLDQHSWNSSNIFSNSGDLRNIIGVMLSIPEIKSSLDKLVGGKDSLTGSKLAELTNDWVAGKDIELISTQYFGGAGEEEITKCCRAIYSTLINSATWGLSSIQKIPNSGLNFENMTNDEVRRINNLPAMIYYGVNTDEAILMRMNNIPRGIADDLGKGYKKQNSNIYNATNNEVSKWLKELPESEWERVSHKAKDISGKEYKKVWKILNGEF